LSNFSYLCLIIQITSPTINATTNTGIKTGINLPREDTIETARSFAAVHTFLTVVSSTT
jgi:hypothetical protein